MPQPKAGEYQTFYAPYVSLVKESTVADLISNNALSIKLFFENIPEEKAFLRYAPGKWSLKELLQHIIDTERIFSYRALTFARKDNAELPGFDENNYAANSNADARSWSELLTEFGAVRYSTDLLFYSFTNEQLGQKGTANGNAITVNALCFVTYGHLLHHCNIITERYLNME